MDEFGNQNINVDQPGGGQPQPPQYGQFAPPQYTQFIPQPAYIPPADPFFYVKKDIRRVALLVGVALTALFAMQFVSAVAQAFFVAVFKNGNMSDSSAGYYAFYLATYFLMFLPALLIVGIGSRQKGVFRLYKAKPTLPPYAAQEEFLAYQNESAARSRLFKTMAPHVLLGVVLMMGTSYAMSVVASFVERAFNLIGLVSPEYFDNEPETAIGWVLYILVLCVAAPVTEEMFFRGAILNMLKPYGAAFAIAVQALMFAIFHGTVAQLPYTLTGGLLLGYTAYKYGGILPTVLIHALNNGISVLMSHFLSDTDIITETLIGCGVYILLIGGAVIIAAAVSKRDANTFSLKEDEGSIANVMPKLTALKTFFTSPAVIVYMSVQAALMLLSMIEHSMGLL